MGTFTGVYPLVLPKARLEPEQRAAYCHIEPENSFMTDFTCKICLVDHNEEMHEATLAIREWHRGQVTKNFEEELIAQPELELEVIEARVA